MSKFSLGDYLLKNTKGLHKVDSWWFETIRRV